MAVGMMNDIPQIISFKWYTMCGDSCRFTKYPIFRKRVKEVNENGANFFLQVKRVKD